MQFFKRADGYFSRTEVLVIKAAIAAAFLIMVGVDAIVGRLS